MCRFYPRGRKFNREGEPPPSSGTPWHPPGFVRCCYYVGREFQGTRVEVEAVTPRREHLTEAEARAGVLR